MATLKRWNGTAWVPVGSDTFLTQTQAANSYAPIWQASTSYAINAPVILPNGKPAVRTAAGTSRAQFDATELALWTLTGGGLDKNTADGLYVPVAQAPTLASDPRLLTFTLMLSNVVAPTVTAVV